MLISARLFSLEIGLESNISSQTGIQGAKPVSGQGRTGAQGFQTAVIDEGVLVLGLLAFALSTAAVIIGFTQAKDFVSRRLRYVDAARSPLAPVVAGVGAALVAAPIVWLLPFVTGVTALAFGLSVGLGVAAGNKEIRRSLPPG